MLKVCINSSLSSTSIAPTNIYKSVRYGKHLIDTGASMRMNSLPNDIKCAITTDPFMKLLKTHLKTQIAICKFNTYLL